MGQGWKLDDVHSRKEEKKTDFVWRLDGRRLGREEEKENEEK